MIQLVVHTEYFSLHKVDWCHDYIWLLITGINTIEKLVVQWSKVDLWKVLELFEADFNMVISANMEDVS